MKKYIYIYVYRRQRHTANALNVRYNYLYPHFEIPKTEIRTEYSGKPCVLSGFS